MKPIETKKKWWEGELERVMTSIATLEFRIETLKGIPDEEIVGEREVAKIGNTVSKISMKAKEVREDCEKELKQKVNMQRALEKLLNV